MNTRWMMIVASLAVVLTLAVGIIGSAPAFANAQQPATAQSVFDTNAADTDAEVADDGADTDAEVADDGADTDAEVADDGADTDAEVADDGADTDAEVADDGAGVNG